MPAAITPARASLWSGLCVGLLGGSFNPAHEGHRHISLLALKHLGVDAVWWMASPQNPLKPEKGMLPLEKRIAIAHETARHPRIHVTDIETRLGTRYTTDTLQALRARFPATRFIWLMGTDNLQQVHLWKDWEDIFRAVPVCVFARPPRGDALKRCPATLRFGAHMLRQDQAPLLKNRPAPAWTVLHTPLNPASATRIRREGKNAR